MARLCREFYIDDTVEIAVGKRIGIDYAQEAKDFPWRFTLC